MRILRYRITTPTIRSVNRPDNSSMHRSKINNNCVQIDTGKTICIEVKSGHAQNNRVRNCVTADTVKKSTCRFYIRYDRAMTDMEVREAIDKLYTGITLAAALGHNGTRIRAFYRMIEEIPLLDQEYMRAQRAQSEIQVSEIKEIADTEPDPNRARVMIDARKWYASKMTPHKYGDRIDLNITQSVDISAALLEAKKRTISTTCHPVHSESSQLTDNTEQNSNMQTGYKPVSDDTSENLDDIFS